MGSNVNTAYMPGSVTTQTRGMMGGALPGGLDDLLAQVIRKRVLTGQAGQAAPRSGVLGGGGPRQAQPPAFAAPAMADTGRGQYMQSLRDRDEIMQMQARENPAPTRMTTFASGANNGYVMDPSVMNAYQRSLYLPQGSTFVPHGGAAGDPGGDPREFEHFQVSSGADARGARGEVGGAAAGTPGGAVVPRGTAPMLTPANAVVPGRRRAL